MLRLLLPLCLTALLLPAQVKRTEVVKATTPADDAKGLDPAVPESVAISTQFERVVVIRVKNQASLLTAIERHVAEQKIRNAVILSGIGSAISTHYHMVTNRTFPSKNLYLENPSTSADVISMSGFVIDGKVHCHLTFADPDKAFGGHLEANTRVFTFAVLALGVLPDDQSVGLKRFDDKTWR
jgi:predicted DNA-binding protein with PD1-like motif